MYGLSDFWLMQNFKNDHFLKWNLCEDHVPGLSDLKPTENVKIFCSEITKQLLISSSDFPHINANLIGLSIGTSHLINVPPYDSSEELYSLKVTLIPAGHCLGSVMFLFEGSNENALYTGDFRLECGSAARIKALHSGAVRKPLSTIYADTTFFLAEHRVIPSRQASCDAVLKVCEDWLSTSNNHVVRIVMRARYSYEYLTSLLRQKFGMKLHVSHDCFERYRELSSVQSDLTFYQNETRIHACSYSLKDSKQLDQLPCGYRPEDNDLPTNLLTVLPTTIWFQERVSFRQLVLRINPNLVRVCFCFHSSYSEILDFLTYLKPTRVLASVIPVGSTMLKVQSDLDELVKSWKVTELFSTSLAAVNDTKFLNLARFRKRKRVPSLSGSPEDFVFPVTISKQAGIIGTVMSSQDNTTNNSARSEHNTTNNSARSEHSTTNNSASSEHNTTNNSASSEHNTTNNSARSEHSTTNNSASSEHSTTNNSASSEHSTTNYSVRSQDSTTNNSDCSQNNITTNNSDCSQDNTTNNSVGSQDNTTNNSVGSQDNTTNNSVGSQDNTTYVSLCSQRDSTSITIYKQSGITNDILNSEDDMFGSQGGLKWDNIFVDDNSTDMLDGNNIANDQKNISNAVNCNVSNNEHISNTDSTSHLAKLTISCSLFSESKIKPLGTVLHNSNVIHSEAIPYPIEVIDSDETCLDSDESNGKVRLSSPLVTIVSQKRCNLLDNFDDDDCSVIDLTMDSSDDSF